MAVEEKNNKYNFDEYIRHGEPSQREKAEAWKTAIGLQAVDGLKPSQYLVETAQKHIVGELTIDEVRKEIDNYYIRKESRTNEERGEEEADKVSANITKLLASPTFAFNYAGLTAIHRHIFEGVYKFAGKIRDYDITKREWVLDNDTVLYVNSLDLRMAIEYDLEQERQFSYKGLTKDETIEHLAKFVSGIWQIHPFGEGNTRTTAVFTIKYLRMLGFEADNSLFAEHSWYFRNALVRANYRNVAKGIEQEPVFLIRFFRTLLLGEQHELKNRYCHIRWKEDDPTSTLQAPNKYPTSTEQVQDKLKPSSPYIEQLVMAIDEEEYSIKEMMTRLNLKDRVNFLNLYLNPAMQTGFVRMLYPDSPRHPRQRYLLTVKGLAFIKDNTNEH
ncbi:MAG: Fic family protein [Muribaculaceae bacterium]|nr:Fic family protein [Muribaculaceae bacterium]